MITDIGYRTRCNLLLNIQCATCGVWVAQEKTRFVEFDGMPHRCAGVPYGKRIIGKARDIALEIQG